VLRSQPAGAMFMEMVTLKTTEGLPGARRAAIPSFVAPQLATLVKEPPAGDDWLHELKFDGYRMLCHVDLNKVKFWSRNGKEWTSKFPNLTLAVKALPAKSAIIDGEVVIFERDGRPSFQKLQHALGAGGNTRFSYVAFDLIYLDGLDLTRVALEHRKLILKKLLDAIPAGGPLRYSDHVEGNGQLFYDHACKTGIEGIVSKLRTSTYESARNRNWIKVKCNKRQEFVVVGHIPSTKGLPGFGSLVLGVYEGRKLVYAGRVGTGFSMKQRVDLKRELDKHARATSPLSTTPRDPGLREAHWIEPDLVAEVSFIEWTSDGSIRHPSFQGLRDDVSPKNVRRELPQD
jgi:bifunctional non-homologous end joining protein LigD